MLIASVALFIFLKIRNINFHPPRKILIKVLFVGLLVAIHWILFFYAIKVSNVSVTLGCFSSIALFTSLLEPIFHRRKILWMEFMLGTIVIIGIYIIFQFETKYAYGIILATLSAFIGSLFFVINGNLIKQHPALTISFYELLSGFIGITIFRFFQNENNFTLLISFSDWMYLLILGIICTAYAFMKTTDLMNHLTPFHITLTINLEPIYGIILAFFIFGESERMTTGFYFGTLIILIAVFVYPFMKRKSD